MSFGQRLKKARAAKNLTQAEVADKLGIDDTTISKYENDKSEPDNVTLEKLADLYGINFDYIHGRETKDKLSKEETEELIADFKRLSEEDKKYLIGLIKRMPKEY